MVSLAKTLPTTAPAIVEVTILAACASPILSFSASSCSVALLFPLVLTPPLFFFVFFSPIGLVWDKEPSCTAAFGAPGVQHDLKPNHRDDESDASPSLDVKHVRYRQSVSLEDAPQRGRPELLDGGAHDSLLDRCRSSRRPGPAEVRPFVRR